MAKDTKERIISAALELFAENGYAGTNIKEIADAVGLVKSALYRHFESKEDIWNAIVSDTAAYYDEHFGSADRLPEIPSSGEELSELTMRMVNFTAHDKRIIMIRKVILSEQFRDERVRDLATRYFLRDTCEIFKKLFDGMTANGSLKPCDTRTLALSYTAPVTALIHLCDREPDKEPEAMERIREFIRLFTATYCLK